MLKWPWQKLFEAMPSRTPETPLLENTGLFLLKFYKQSGSEKKSIAIKIEKIRLVIIQRQEKHLENEQKGFSVKKLLLLRGILFNVA